MLCSLDIVIVNWNTGLHLRGCLASIAAAERDGFALERVVVVDNASTDGSADALEVDGLPLTVIRNRENRGFGVACNQGARGSTADYILFLNPDTRLEVDSLCVPLRFMEEPDHQQVGIAGVKLIDGRGKLRRHCAYFPTPLRFLLIAFHLNKRFMRDFPYLEMSAWDHGDTRAVDRVKGAFYLVRRQVYRALNGFDERFFLYWEDVDFSLRARNAGWQSYFIAETCIHHPGGVSAEQVAAASLHQELRSRILYSFKHFHPWAAASVTLAVFTVQPITHLLLKQVRPSPRARAAVFQAYCALWHSAPALLREVRRRRRADTHTHELEPETRAL